MKYCLNCKRILLDNTSHKLKRKYCNVKCRDIHRKVLTDQKNYPYVKSLLEHNTPESIYILGLLWADGYITTGNKIGLELVENDFNDILPILLQSLNWKITIRQRKNRKKKICSYNITDRNLYTFLYNNDYHQKKINPPTKILSLIPIELHHYWWRGYFDGDGCFYYGGCKKSRQMTMASSYEQDWLEHEKLFNKYDLKYTIQRIITKQHKKNGSFCKNSTIRITDKRDVKRFGEYIYQGKQFGFNRKLVKFKLMIKDIIDQSNIFGSVIYTFNNIKTNETFTGTRYDFCKKYNISNYRLSVIRNKPNYHTKGWIFVCNGL